MDNQKIITELRTFRAMEICLKRMRAEFVSLDTAAQEHADIKADIERTESKVAIIDFGLKQLDDIDRKILEGFYIDRKPNHVQRLCDAMMMEKSHIYRLKDRALHNFALYAYGNIAGEK